MFAVLHIPDFALHSILRTEPHAAPRPAALFAATHQKSVVLAANTPARAAGVDLGMTAPQAVARCPDLLVRTPQPAAEAEARAALLAAALTLSPAIEDTAPGVCTADLRALTTPPEPLATAALTQLSVLGLPATVGLAATPLLALYAARSVDLAPAPASLPPTEPTAPLPGFDAFCVADAPAPFLTTPHPPLDTTPAPAAAPPFSQLSTLNSPLSTPPPPYRPHAARIARVDHAPTFLARLPLAVAAPGAELAAVLHDWGLRTLGDLTALPRDEIIRRFGRAGLDLWQRASGGEPRPLRLVPPAQTFAATLDFENEIETLEPLLFVLRRFVDRLALELRAAQLVAAELTLTLRLADDQTHARSFRLPEPTAEPGILFRALHTHLESLQTAAAIAGAELRVAPTRPLVRQHGLFETGLRDPHGFAETLARVSALVNADRVGTPQFEDTHRPDAFRLVPPPAVVPPPAPPPLHPVAGLPLRRFRPPLLANLEFTQGTRRPTYLFTHRFHGDIAEIRGPWRSSGDWWQSDRAWHRLEYDITLADGGLYRLLQIDDAYFIEGEYD